MDVAELSSPGFIAGPYPVYRRLRGAHFCLDAPLARPEARITLPKLLSEPPNPSLASDGPLSWRANTASRGLESLRVGFEG